MHTVKKTVAFFLAVIMVLSLVPMTISAATEAQVRLSGPDIANPGDTIEITASIASNPGIASMRFTLHYSEDLELVSVNDQGKFGEFHWSETDSARASGECSLVWENGMKTSNFTDNGDFLTLRFQIASEAQPGTLTVSLTAEEAWNKDLGAVSVTTAASSTEILSTDDENTSDSYILYVAESAANAAVKNGSSEQPYYYISEALERIKKDGAAVIGDRRIVILVIGTVYDKVQSDSNQQFAGGNEIKFGEKKPDIFIRSLHSDPDNFATILTNYVKDNTANLYSYWNNYKFSNINVAAAPGSPTSSVYCNGNNIEIGENCTFKTAKNANMSLYGGGSSAGATYKDFSIKVLSGSWSTISLGGTWRGEIAGDNELVVGGDAVVTYLYSGANSYGANSTNKADTNNSTLFRTGSATFNAEVTVCGNAKITNFYGGSYISSGTSDYTFHTNIVNTVADQAEITNFYNSGRCSVLTGDSRVQNILAGGTVTHYYNGQTAAGGRCGIIETVFMHGYSIPNGVEKKDTTGTTQETIQYSADLTDGDVALPSNVTQIFERVVAGSGTLILGDEADGEKTVYYRILSVEGTPKILVNYRPKTIGQPLVALNVGLAADSVSVSTLVGGTMYTSSFLDFDYGGFVSSGAAVSGNSFIMEENFKLRYFYDEVSVDWFSSNAETPFTAQYSTDNENFKDAVIEKAVRDGVVYYSFIVEGIAAKNIGDTIYVNTSLSGKTDEYSIKDACGIVINHPDMGFSVLFSDLCKAILNYGRAAQLYFNHNLENPILESYYEGIVADEFTDETTVGDRTAKAAVIRGNSLLMKDYVSIKFYLSLDPVAGLDPDKLTAIISSSSKTEKVKLTLNGGTAGYYSAAFALPARQMREMVTIYIVDENENEISNHFQTSIPSYCAGMLYDEKVTGYEADLYNRLMAYVDTAKNYLDHMNPYEPEEDEMPPMFH